MVIDSIKEGFELANRNLQLVVVRIVATIINIVMFVMIMSLPIFVAIVYMGFDLASARDLVPHFIDNPFDIVTRYLGLIFLLLFSFVFYLTIASVIYLYVLGGSLGVLRASDTAPECKFSVRAFFADARSNFWPLFRLISLIMFWFMITLFVLLVIDGTMSVIVAYSIGSGSTLSVFFRSFIMMSLVIFTLALCLAGVIMSAYAIVAFIAERGTAMESIKSAFGFLKRNPKAMFLYLLLVSGILAVSALFYVVKFPFEMVPLLGMIAGFFLTIMNAFVQGYLAVVFWSSLLVSYMKEIGRPGACPPSDSAQSDGMEYQI